jgi:hypothetical protein
MISVNESMLDCRAKSMHELRRKKLVHYVS